MSLFGISNVTQVEDMSYRAKLFTMYMTYKNTSMYKTTNFIDIATIAKITNSCTHKTNLYKFNESVHWKCTPGSTFFYTGAHFTVGNVQPLKINTSQK